MSGNCRFLSGTKCRAPISNDNDCNWPPEDYQRCAVYHLSAQFEQGVGAPEAVQRTHGMAASRQPLGPPSPQPPQGAAPPPSAVGPPPRLRQVQIECRRREYPNIDEFTGETIIRRSKATGQRVDEGVFGEVRVSVEVRQGRGVGQAMCPHCGQTITVEATEYGTEAPGTKWGLGGFAAAKLKAVASGGTARVSGSDYLKCTGPPEHVIVDTA